MSVLLKQNIFNVYLACRINLAKLDGLNIFNSGFMFVCSFLSFFLKDIEIEICETQLRNIVRIKPRLRI